MLHPSVSNFAAAYMEMLTFSGQGGGAGANAASHRVQSAAKADERLSRPAPAEFIH